VFFCALCWLKCWLDAIGGALAARPSPRDRWRRNPGGSIWAGEWADRVVSPVNRLVDSSAAMQANQNNNKHRIPAGMHFGGRG
jgi:hypothetical protein